MTEKCPICWEEVRGEMVRNCSESDKHGICADCSKQYTDSLCAVCRMPLVRKVETTTVTYQCDLGGPCSEDHDTGYCYRCCKPM